MYHAPAAVGSLMRWAATLAPEDVRKQRRALPSRFQLGGFWWGIFGGVTQKSRSIRL